MKLINVKHSMMLLALAVSMTGVWAVDSPMYRGGYGHSGSGEEITLPTVLAWRWVNTTSVLSNESSPAIVGDTAYLGMGDRLVALDVATGETKWKFPADAGASGNFKLAPSVADGMVYAANTEGALYCIRADSGKLRWTIKAPITTPPVVVDGKVYFGGRDGGLYVFDSSTAEPARGKNIFRSQDSIITAPLYCDGTLVFMTGNGTLVGVPASSDKAKWFVRLKSSINNVSPIAIGTTVYVASGQVVASLNGSSGTLRWQKELPNEITTSLAADSKNIYAITDANQVFKLDTTGKPSWKTPIQLENAASAPPVVSGNVLIIPQRRGLITAYDTTTQKLVWSYTTRPIKSPVVQSTTGTETQTRQDYITVTANPVIANGWLMFVTEDGGVLGFNNKEGIDQTAPQVVFTLPEAGDQMPGQPPIDIYVRIDDEGSGLNPNSIKLYLDDQTIDAKYDAAKGLISYRFLAATSTQPWEDGRRSLKIVAVDWAGNQLEEIWTVFVDNSLRAIAKKRYSGSSPGGGPSGGGGGAGYPGLPPGGGRSPGGPGIRPGNK